ncbi:serine hydroxymethyltransferase [Roseibium sp. RKSG952]|uniref:DUF6898 family protein n=1 Tax=Roseibium sp. RKSG952 TaxID=2529384 RepID=UPI0012BCC110|nr:serine hydroxymethyltransferase [Roseibium sp. RKSG952]MTH97758.1 serine hydroxymethyltransferase [Roseibium sp. RKSG952]
MTSTAPRAGEIYLEYQRIGQQVRVTAIDGASGVEVVVFGPLKASEHDLKQLAVRKLQRRLEREKVEPDPFRKKDGRGFGTF